MRQWLKSKETAVSVKSHTYCVANEYWPDFDRRITSYFYVLWIHDGVRYHGGEDLIDTYLWSAAGDRSVYDNCRIVDPQENVAFENYGSCIYALCFMHRFHFLNKTTAQKETKPANIWSKPRRKKSTKLTNGCIIPKLRFAPKVKDLKETNYTDRKMFQGDYR